MGIRVEQHNFEEHLGATSQRQMMSPLLGCNWVEVELSDAGATDHDHDLDTDLLPPVCPVLAVSASPRWLPDYVDVVVDSDDEADLVKGAIDSHPHASAVLVQLLRHNQSASVADGLTAESLAYSSLQHGHEFEGWLQSYQPGQLKSDQGRVLLDRQGGDLHITLSRPGLHNAYSSAMRDQLSEALMLAEEDRSIGRIVIRGEGESFCSGGDLQEFGRARDAAVAHLVRLTRSPAMMLSGLNNRLECYLQGACIGAGIELAAFAALIIARENAFFQLPEVSYGLVPGAGGSVSVLRRIGRRRTAWLALSSKPISAERALEWGLIDRIV